MKRKNNSLKRIKPNSKFSNGIECSYLMICKYDSKIEKAVIPNRIINDIFLSSACYAQIKSHLNSTAPIKICITQLLYQLF